MILAGGMPPQPRRDGAEAVSVRGRQAWLSNQGESFSLAWSEPDLNLTLNGFGVSRYDLLRVAESVVRVDDDEWNQTTPPSVVTSHAGTLGPSTFASMIADATELARLTTDSGQLVRLVSLSGARGICIDAGIAGGCNGDPDPSVGVPQGTALLAINTIVGSQRYAAILVPAGTPTGIVLRRVTGETVQSVRSSDDRYLLFADASPSGQYEITDATGQVLARVTT